MKVNYDGHTHEHVFGLELVFVRVAVVVHFHTSGS